MKIEFESCVIDDEKISLLARFTITFEELKRESEKGSYRYEAIREKCISDIGHKVSEEYLQKNKMDILRALNKDEIVNAIQIKIIERFSLQQR